MRRGPWPVERSKRHSEALGWHIWFLCFALSRGTREFTNGDRYCLFLSDAD
jgi:hypothetical protein